MADSGEDDRGRGVGLAVGDGKAGGVSDSSTASKFTAASVGVGKGVLLVSLEGDVVDGDGVVPANRVVFGFGGADLEVGGGDALDPERDGIVRRGVAILLIDVGVVDG